MSAEDAVYLQMERVANLRAHCGRQRRAMVAAENALKIGDASYALRIITEALALPNPDQP